MSEKRRGLGRGLGALIPQAPAGDRPVDVFFPGADRPAPSLPGTTTGADGGPDGSAATSPRPDVATAPADEGELAAVPGATYAELPLDAVRPNPKQPRTVFDEDDMAELVHSIREIGVLQPVVVRRLDEPTLAALREEDPSTPVRFELIMGERRWRASRAAGRDTVPAIVKATDDDDMLRDALLENLHRSQLNALEEAAAYQQLLNDFGCTQEELAQRIGRSRPQISNTLRLLRLPPVVARRVAAGVLSAGHARALLAVEDGAAMERLAQRIVAEGLSVRSVEEIVALGGEDAPAPRRSQPRPGGRHPQLDDWSAALSDHLDTRAAITLGKRKGKVTIEFASVDDLHRIMAAMGVDPQA